MPAEEGSLRTCQECGASIYPEHLQRHLAEQFEGRLLCVHCLRAKRAGQDAGRGPGPTGKPGVGPTSLSATPPAGLPTQEDVPLALVDEEESAASIADALGVRLEKKTTAIKSFGGGPGGMMEGIAASEANLRRPLLRDSPNATRCRVFHCKLADAAMVYLCEQINGWADSNDEIQIKFATSVIGVVEGKHADPHLIVTVFY